jgi:fucose 4-O-acetylase-like acetyltransferase
MSENVTRSTRDMLIDALKGIAILLVVFGHSIQIF